MSPPSAAPVPQQVLPGQPQELVAELPLAAAQARPRLRLQLCPLEPFARPVMLTVLQLMQLPAALRQVRVAA